MTIKKILRITLLAFFFLFVTQLHTTEVKADSAWYNGVNYDHVFNVKFYYDNYPDLRSSIGMNGPALLQHFVEHGINEGRQASGEFNVNYYKSAYGDISGMSNHDAMMHFVNFGAAEGRCAAGGTVNIPSTYSSYIFQELLRFNNHYTINLTSSFITNVTFFQSGTTTINGNGYEIATVQNPKCEIINVTGMLNLYNVTFNGNGGYTDNGLISTDQWCTVNIYGGTRFRNVSGWSVYGNENSTINVHDIDINNADCPTHASRGGGIGSYGTINFFGGTITNCAAGLHVNGARTGYAKLNISGGNVYGNTDGIQEINNAQVAITGGNVYNSAAWDIYHDGADGNNGLQVYNGFGNNSYSTKVFLNGRNKYINTNILKAYTIGISNGSYVRGKWLVSASDSSLQQQIYNNMTFSDSGAFTKRSYGNQTAVWDHYMQTTKHRKMDPNTGTWGYAFSDVTNDIWGGAAFSPQFLTPPQYYRTYARTQTDPNVTKPYDGQQVSVTVNQNNIFYACYYPKQYFLHFDGNGATAGSMSDQTLQWGQPAALQSNAYIRQFHITYDLNGGTSAQKTQETATATFCGWKISPYALQISYKDQQMVSQIGAPGERTTLYAGWQDNAIQLPNAGKDDTYWDPKLGWCKYFFTGWYTAADGGICVGDGSSTYTPTSDITLYAHWRYQVCVYYDGNKNDGGGMSMDDPAKGDLKTYGAPYTIRDNGYTKTGYDFFGWNKSQVAEDGDAIYAPGQIYNTDIPLTLFSIWRTRFDVAYIGSVQTKGKDQFDNNSGNDYTQLAGNNVTLKKNTDMTTEKEVSYTDKETGEEIKETVTGTGVGWAFSKDIPARYKEAYIPDDTTYTTADFYALAERVNGLTFGKAGKEYKGDPYTLHSSDMAVANLYRVWDYGPMIEAYDLYDSLADAQDGKITKEVLLNQAKAVDAELITADNPVGRLKNGEDQTNHTSFTIPDYAPTDFTQFRASGSVTETYEATDSAGNVTKKRITVYITDTTSKVVKPQKTTRFIDEKYYRKPYEEGGLEDTSIWKTDPAYKAVLEDTFLNIKNDTPKQIYELTPQVKKEMKAYMKEHGYFDTKEAGALEGFYERFLKPNQIK